MNFDGKYDAKRKSRGEKMNLAIEIFPKNAIIR